MMHYEISCPICKVTWQQCRCPDMNKNKTEEICPTCRQKVHEMEKDRTVLAPTGIGHCEGAHCHYLTERRCICLCAKCAEAKKADH